MSRYISMAVLMLAVCSVAVAQQPATSQPAPVVRSWHVPEVLKRVPILTHDAKGRLPMICITPFAMNDQDNSFAQGKPLSAEVIRQLKARGLTQFIRSSVTYIPYALALQKEGAGVIVMDDWAFNGPNGNDENDQPVKAWLHVLPKDYKPLERPAQQKVFPCPLVLDGWRAKAERVRTVFRKFKEAGVEVQGVWLDLEVEPYGGMAQWKEAQACSRCQKQFPRGVLDDHKKYAEFISRWRAQVFSAYVVAPILESYPNCSVTNWCEVISSPEIPTATWTANGAMAPRGIGMYTAANPVVYGDTAFYGMHWKKEWNWPLDVPHMDRLYTQMMLMQISTHEANARRLAPEKLSIPWVARVCMDDPDPKIPILSRERYREVLRHAWLRGADGMQIFNPAGAKDAPAPVEEIVDAVAVYDEMLAFREFLEDGATMNLSVPAATDDGPFWSGLRLKDRAVIRAFTMGDKPVKAKVKAFENTPEVEITCPPKGATYMLTRHGDKVDVREVAAK